MDNTHSSSTSLILIVLFRSKPRGGSSYSDIHDQETLDSLSGRPWKEKEGWNANRPLLLNSPDPIVPHFWNVQCQSHWMGKSPIPKTDYVMYFICWVTGGHFTRGFYCINLPLFNSCWSIYSGGGCRADDFKADSHSLDREDRQDFVIRCRTYSFQFNGHSQHYALKRTRTSTLFSTRFWVSRVYHFTTKASWKWIIFHEYDIYLVWCMEYMTKVEF